MKWHTKNVVVEKYKQYTHANKKHPAAEHMAENPLSRAGIAGGIARLDARLEHPAVLQRSHVGVAPDWRHTSENVQL